MIIMLRLALQRAARGKQPKQAGTRLACLKKPRSQSPPVEQPRCGRYLASGSARTHRPRGRQPRRSRLVASPVLQPRPWLATSRWVTEGPSLERSSPSSPQRHAAPCSWSLGCAGPLAGGGGAGRARAPQLFGPACCLLPTVPHLNLSPPPCSVNPQTHPPVPPWPRDDADLGGRRALQPLRADAQVPVAAGPSAGLQGCKVAGQGVAQASCRCLPASWPARQPTHPSPRLAPLPPCSCCWRRGPASKPILCNACGSRYLVKRSLEGYQPLQTRRENTSKAAAAADSSGGEGSGKAAARRAPAPAAGRAAKPKRAAQKR